MSIEKFTREDIVNRARAYYEICWYDMDTRQFILNEHGFYGCDCSSFVSKCYGLDVSWNTDKLYNNLPVRPASSGNTFSERYLGIQHGDIVIITKGQRTDNEKYGHCGIYDAENHVIIQASTGRDTLPYGTPTQRGMRKRSEEESMWYAAYISYTDAFPHVGEYDDEFETPLDIDIGEAYGQTPQSEFNPIGLKLGEQYLPWSLNHRDYTKRYVLRKGASK